jgi:hypothetical protein
MSGRVLCLCQPKQPEMQWCNMTPCLGEYSMIQIMPQFWYRFVAFRGTDTSTNTLYFAFIYFFGRHCSGSTNALSSTELSEPSRPSHYLSTIGVGYVTRWKFQELQSTQRMNDTHAVSYVYLLRMDMSTCNYSMASFINISSIQEKKHQKLLPQYTPH